MPQNSDNQIALFIRDEKTGRYAFNTKALKVLGIDPAVARERGYPLKATEETEFELGGLTGLGHVDQSARLRHAVINRDLQSRKTGFDFQCGGPRSFGRRE